MKVAVSLALAGLKLGVPLLACVRIGLSGRYFQLGLSSGWVLLRLHAQVCAYAIDGMAVMSLCQ